MNNQWIIMVSDNEARRSSVVNIIINKYLAFSLKSEYKCKIIAFHDYTLHYWVLSMLAILKFIVRYVRVFSGMVFQCVSKWWKLQKRCLQKYWIDPSSLKNGHTSCSQVHECHANSSILPLIGRLLMLTIS